MKPFFEETMPLLASFYGIILTMNFIDHNPPHFHAKFGKFEAYFDFDGKLIKGEMPNKKRILIEAWAVLHKEELEADWILASNKEAVIRIEPLK